MGAGALSRPVLEQLQEMREEDAVRIFVDNGVPRTDARTVTNRVRGLDSRETVDGETIAMLLEGMAPETQDTLVAITAKPGHGAPEVIGAPAARLRRRGQSEPSPPKAASKSQRRRSEPKRKDERPRRAKVQPLFPRDLERSVPYPDQLKSGSLCNFGSANPRIVPEEFLDEWRVPTARGAESPPPPLDAMTRSPADSPVTRRRSVPEGDMVQAGKWKAGKLIGSGSYGSVFQGLRTDTGAMIAVKSLILTDAARPPEDSHKEDDAAALRELKTCAEEIELMSSLRHENIVQYLGSELDADGVKLHIFQEWARGSVDYVPGGSLCQVLRQFGGTLEPAVAQRYLTHCLQGLIYLHEHRIVHRDVKGENILVSDAGVAKLCDMGASKRIDAGGTLLETQCSLKGTPYFMAPEQMRQKRVGRRADIWALGGVALLCATGEPPWRCLKLTSPYALMMTVLESDAGPPLDQYELGPDLRDLLDRCFTRDVDARPTARQLLRHAFFAREEPPPPAVSSVSASSSALEGLRARLSREPR